MIQLDTGNVLLKPSHRKQVSSWMKRATKMVSRLRNVVLRIVMTRTGRGVEATAVVNNRGNAITLRTRATDWRHAMRDLIKMLATHLHEMLIANRRIAMG